MTVGVEQRVEAKHLQLVHALLNVEEKVSDRFDPQSEDFQRQFRKNCFADEVINLLISQNAFSIPEEMDEKTEHMIVHPYEGAVSKNLVSIYSSALLKNASGFYDLHLFVADYFPRQSLEEIGLKEFRSLLRKAYNFYKFSINGKLEESMNQGHCAYQAIRSIRLNANNINNVRVWVLTNRLYKGTQKVSRESDAHTGVEHSAKVIDIEEINNMFSGDLEINQSFEEIGGLPCIVDTANANQDYSCILTIIPGSILAQLYHLHGTSLVQANVRAYLGDTKKVNAAIKDTALEKPERFLAYNNGLAIAAKDAVIKNNDRLMELKSFQIINGGQTTATLFHTWLASKTSKKDTNKEKYLSQLAKVKVPVKIVVAANTMSEAGKQQLQEQISEAANSQNVIRRSDLSANQPFHIQFESISKRLMTSDDKHWFYERSRSLYKAEIEKFKGNKVQKARFLSKYPKEKLVQKTDIALSTLAWQGQSQDCAKGQEHAFRVFNDQVHQSVTEVHLTDEDVRQYICRWILFAELEATVRKRKELGISNPRVPVIYALGLFANKFETQFAWDVLWQKQHISDELKVSLCALVSRVEAIMRKNMGSFMISMWGRQNNCSTTLKKDFTFEGLDFSNIPELK